MDASFFDDLDRQLRGMGELAAASKGKVGPERPSPLTILHQLSEVLGARDLERGPLLDALLDGAVSLTGAERGLMLLFTDDTCRELAVDLARGRDQQPLDPTRFEYSRTIIDKVLASGEPSIVPRAAVDPRVAGAHSVARLKISSIMCAPLRLRVHRAKLPGQAERRRTAAREHHRILGAIYLDSSRPDHAFGASDLGVLETLANHATSIISHLKYFEEATTDRLTGLANRRHLGALLDDERSVSIATGASFVYAVVDLDHFRDYGERHGHRAGDELLRTVAGALAKSLRRFDVACRYGSDKFALLLPGTDLDGATGVLDRVRALFAEARIPLGFTVGLVCFDQRATTEELIARADQALWSAKAAGHPARAWDPSLAGVVERADKLAGILTGDWATDYRNVMLLLEAIGALAARTDLDELAVEALDRAIAMVGADRGALVLDETAAGAARRLARGHDRADVPLAQGDVALAREAVLARRILGQGTARMAAPLAARGSAMGAIVVERADGAFSDNDATFLGALARRVADAIDAGVLVRANAAQLAEIRSLNAQLRAEVQQQHAELAEAKRALGERFHRDRLIGRSSAMQRVYAVIDKVAPTTLPVLVQGESGTGKEVVARTIHHASARAAGRFLSENCAAISPALLESELFGHVKGAFTGAIADKQGLFEHAHGGTLFLDEIGDLEPELQAKLLRALEAGEIRPVGSQHTRKVDVRILAASNKDLEAMCAAGAFRVDLYYRLAVVKITLPPLRERPEDLPLLADALLRETNSPLAFTPDALRALAAWRWPGNVRELKNVIDKLVLFAEGPAIEAADVARQLGELRAAVGAVAADGGSTEDAADYRAAKKEFERAYLARALARAGGNISRMAKAIDVDRRYLYDLLAKHQLREGGEG